MTRKITVRRPVARACAGKERIMLLEFNESYLRLQQKSNDNSSELSSDYT